MRSQFQAPSTNRLSLSASKQNQDQKQTHYLFDFSFFHLYWPPVVHFLQRNCSRLARSSSFRPFSRRTSSLRLLSLRTKLIRLSQLLPPGDQINKVCFPSPEKCFFLRHTEHGTEILSCGVSEYRKVGIVHTGQIVTLVLGRFCTVHGVQQFYSTVASPENLEQCEMKTMS